MKCDQVKSNHGDSFEDSFIITPHIFRDDRGFFFESWNKKTFEEIVGKSIDFVQDNHSGSEKGVLRGLHYQLPPNAQGKLISCVVGDIFDVVVDMRRNSPTFKQWGGVHLNSSNRKKIWVPSGFAHGFLTISDYAEIIYKVTNFWNKDSERSLCWNDSEININWPLQNEKPFLSSKDRNCLTCSQLDSSEIF